MVGWPTRPQSVSLFRFELPLGECGCSMGLFHVCLGFSLLLSARVFFSGASPSAGLLATCLSFSLPIKRHSAGLLLTCFSFSLPAEGHFLNKTTFRGESFC